MLATLGSSLGLMGGANPSPTLATLIKVNLAPVDPPIPLIPTPFKFFGMAVDHYKDPGTADLFYPITTLNSVRQTWTRAPSPIAGIYKDTPQVHYPLFMGHSAPALQADMVFYYGHSTYMGPSFPDTPANLYLSTPAHSYFGRGVKWYVNAGCQGLFDGITTDGSTNWIDWDLYSQNMLAKQSIQRFRNYFARDIPDWSMDPYATPNRWRLTYSDGLPGTLHAIFGNRSDAWSFSGDCYYPAIFFKQILQGSAMGPSWMAANLSSNVEIGVLCIQAPYSYGPNYYYECLNSPAANPQDDPMTANNPIILNAHWLRRGNPSF